MSPNLVLNEDEKKERFKKHLEKKEKSKQEERPYFQMYPRNIEFFHQQLLFNTPFQNPMFGNSDEPNKFNFERRTIFNRQGLQTFPDLEVDKWNQNVNENSHTAPATATSAITDVEEPFAFYDGNTQLQVGEDPTAPTAHQYDDISSGQNLPDMSFLGAFPRQRSFLDTGTNVDYAKEAKNQSTKIFHRQVEAIESEKSSNTIPTTINHLNIIPKLVLNQVNLDIFKLNKASKYSIQNPLLDSAIYLHKKFSKCTDRNLVEESCEEIEGCPATQIRYFFKMV